MNYSKHCPQHGLYHTAACPGCFDALIGERPETSSTITYYCPRHNNTHAGVGCVFCKEEAEARQNADQVDTLRMRLDVQSQTIESLMRRIDGLSRRLMRAERALERLQEREP